MSCHRFVQALFALGIAAALSWTAIAGVPDPCDGVSETANTSLARITVATGVTAPVFVAAPPGDTNRVFILSQSGQIRFIARGSTNPAVNTLFLDIASRIIFGGERGLLGLAFDPDFATNGKFYVNYTRTPDGDTIIAQFRTLDGTPNTLGDPTSEKILLRVDQPLANHNGGWIAFGPDGYLYIGMGDGGGSGDPGPGCGNGQSLTTLLGKILRIDPDGASGRNPDCGLDPGPYTVPFTNPLDDGASGNCDEIWAYGVRNPWRNSHDALTGDFYIGDVGQNCFEEINWVSSSSTGGENYGWKLFEGRHCYNSGAGCGATSSPAGCSPACSDPAPTGDPVPNGTTLPVWDYAHSGGNCSLTGGYVYRGCRMPSIRGKYFYGDYCVGTVLSFQVSGGVVTNPQSWGSISSGLAVDLTSFGQDAQGELYITDEGGSVYKIVPPTGELEVSGTGAGDSLLLDADGDWSWENLSFSTMIPFPTYRVWRADVSDGVFNVGELFECIHTTTGTTWTFGGDTSNPPVGGMFAYIVTAIDGSGTQTSPGGVPVRTLSTAACP